MRTRVVPYGLLERQNLCDAGPMYRKRMELSIRTVKPWDRACCARGPHVCPPPEGGVAPAIAPMKDEPPRAPSHTAQHTRSNPIRQSQLTAINHTDTGADPNKRVCTVVIYKFFTHTQCAVPPRPSPKGRPSTGPVPTSALDNPSGRHAAQARPMDTLCGPPEATPSASAQPKTRT